MTELEGVGEQGVGCAHLTIQWQTVTVNGLTRGWWECTSGCGAKFWPLDVPTERHRLREQLAEANLKQELLCQRAAEIGMSPEIVLLQAASYHKGVTAERERLAEANAKYAALQDAANVNRKQLEIECGRLREQLAKQFENHVCSFTAKQAVAAEGERCAKIADDYFWHVLSNDQRAAYGDNALIISREIANAIRRPLEEVNDVSRTKD